MEGIGSKLGSFAARRGEWLGGSLNLANLWLLYVLRNKTLRNVYEGKELAQISVELTHH